MNQNILNTDLIVLLIQFQFKGTNGQFITNIEGVAEVLKKHNTTSIESIKEYDRTKQKFIRVSKDKIYRWLSFETEAVELLKKANFFNSKKH